MMSPCLLLTVYAVHSQAHSDNALTAELTRENDPIRTNFRAYVHPSCAEWCLFVG